jgi:3-hydroxy-9,10-secoandrosta-1,3,5(10)-triene-9,17-dione monooxygenase reductase component
VNAHAADPAAFRAVMRRHPSGVTVVTSLREGEPRGITLSAFASVSVNPPMLLICVNREARSYLYISSSRIFCVNLLGTTQRELAERFSGRIKEHQFDDIAWSTDVTGAPVLDGTIGHFDCAVEAEHHAGSHSIFIGRVLACATREGAPLGYYEGEFRDFQLEER